MEKEFVPYDRALRLKELGFYCDCFGDYFKFVKFFNQDPFLVTDDDRYRIEEDNEEEDVLRVPAPTFSQAFRWFREKYGVHSSPKKYDETKWWVEWGTWTSSVFETFEEAELTWLDKLIEIVENK